MKKIGVIAICFLMLAMLYPVTADFDPMAGCDVGLNLVDPASTSLTVGRTFNITEYVNTTENLDAWISYNITWTNHPICVNVQNVFIDQSDWPFSADGTYNNNDGWIKNTQGFNTSPFNNTNMSLSYINFTTVKPARCRINITSFAAQFEGNDVPVNNIYNITILIHPQDTTGFTATAGPKNITLNWTIPSYADKVYLYANDTTYPTTHTGQDIYNGSASLYKHSGLDYSATWYYSIWTYNNTYNLWSLTYQTATGTTFTPPNLTKKYLTNATYEGFDLAAWCETDDVDASLEVSESPSFTPSNLFWANASSRTDPTYGYQHFFNSADLHTIFTKNCTVYYRIRLFNETYHNCYVNNTGEIKLWSPSVSVVNPTDGATDVDYASVALQAAVTTPWGSEVTTTFYEGSYASKSDLGSSGGVNKTYQYTWTNLNSSETYYWGAYVVTNSTEDNGNISTRLGYTKYWNSSATHRWLFTTQGFSVRNPFPGADATEIARPSGNLSGFIVGSNINVSIQFYNMTPVTETWTVVENFTEVTNAYVENTGLSSLGTDFIWGNTTYAWRFVLEYRGTESTTYYNYTTVELVTTGIGDRNARYDVDNNALTIDVFDMSLDWGHRTVAAYAPYQGIYDVNNDDVVNTADVSAIWAHKTVAN